MAEVASTMTLKIGDVAPDFGIPDETGKVWRLVDFEGAEALVVAFVCNHCPFVTHLAGEFGRFAEEYQEKGVDFLAICANDIENYPQDAPEKMIAFAEDNGWDFPYLFDESQETAKAWFAACTPDFYVFDAEQRLTYTGQFDDTRPESGGKATGDDLRAAVDAVLAGADPLEPQQPSTGCNIKWKPGNEPGYFQLPATA